LRRAHSAFADTDIFARVSADRGDPANFLWRSATCARDLSLALCDAESASRWAAEKIVRGYSVDIFWNFPKQERPSSRKVDISTVLCYAALSFS
jgi:hypothetical protein